ncbi:nicotinate phosphoribosyltransferase [Candidatus Xianfuyuplasma coldseepsis]|uniref:Nicotinate phosphoribosyltransferase n=1 Tax=Candidatus Xianfuyuplasma coldseepsis TaxID=2782163 RepID=A0A7L7KRR3_9MOLU|nr:nicotinate phosphoribosyltransferase [Xianfuyuplasma coldseepsis]QMS84644.1 nicotinate phosphoribosyltransferase [Xianfuyuplasma coldseepsis]
MKSLQLTMLTDFYELTMAYGYYKSCRKDEMVCFDLFFRDNPDNGGYSIFAGLESIIQHIENFRFVDEDIEYLRNRDMFSDDFLEYLRNLRFTGDVESFLEGSVMFPYEPIITVKAPIIEAQLLETYLLQVVNHQSLIATKASRIKQSAKHRLVLEMGARRAHGASSSVLGARAASIGGIDATSNVLADQLYGVKALGTMAHSWVQLFDTEYEAFKTYAEIYPTNCTLLVDTYDTLKSGIPNAIKVIKELLVPKGVNHYSIRIDSGDLTYLTKKARKMLDDAGLENCHIVVSNALDEYLIKDLLNQGAPIDIFGVGERLITAKSDPVFGAVYKLAAISKNGTIQPTIKISENVDKITTPHYKNVYRIVDENGKFEADLITLHDEVIDTSKPLTIFDPKHPWKSKTFDTYELVPMLQPIFRNGKLVYDQPELDEIITYAKDQKEKLWDEVKRFEYPHKYYVDLSKPLYDLKQKMIQSAIKKG